MPLKIMSRLHYFFLVLLFCITNIYAFHISSNEEQLSNIAKHVTNNERYLVLDKTMSFASQIKAKPNTVFEIRDIFDLGNKSINLPDNAILLFRGGVLKNGTIKGNNTIIDAPNYRIFEEDCRVTGSFLNTFLYADWFEDLQMAVDLGSSNSGVILLSPKTYLLKNTLVIEKGVSLIGCGNEGAFRENRGTIISYQGTGPVIALNGTKESPKKNISIKNLKIRGNGQNFKAGTNVGLYIGPKAYYCQFENISLYACSNGVELDNAWNLRFESVNPYYCNNGFYLNGVSGAPLTSSIFSTCVVYNCSVGFNFAGDMSATTIESCATDGCSIAMKLNGCFGVTISSFEFEKHSKYGIYIDNSDCYATFIGLCPRSPLSEDVTHIKIDRVGRVTFTDMYISKSVMSGKGYSVDIGKNSTSKVSFANCNIQGRNINFEDCIIR